MDEKDRMIEVLKTVNEERGCLITELITDYLIEQDKVKKLERMVNRMLELICNG